MAGRACLLVEASWLKEQVRDPVLALNFAPKVWHHISRPLALVSQGLAPGRDSQPRPRPCCSSTWKSPATPTYNNDRLQSASSCF